MESSFGGNPLLSFIPTSEYIENVKLSLNQRISCIQECIKKVSEKYENFKHNLDIANPEELEVKFKSFLDDFYGRLEKFQALLGVNIFLYSFEGVRNEILDKKLSLKIEDFTDPFVFFSQSFIKEVDKTSEDYIGMIKNKIMIKEKYNLMVDGHFADITSVDISKDDLFIASASADHTVGLWEYSSLSLLRVYKEHKNFVSGVVFREKAGQIISSSWDASVIIRKYDGSLEFIIKNEDKSEINCLDITESQSFIAFGSWNLTIKLWDITKYQLSYNFDVSSTGSIKTLSFSKLGTFLACGTFMNEIFIFSSKDKKMCDALLHHNHKVNCVCFSADERFIVSGSWDKTVLVFEQENNKYGLKKKLAGHSSEVTCVDITDDNSRAVSGSLDCSIVVWNLPETDLVCKIEFGNFTIRTLKYNKDSNQIIAGGSKRCLYKVLGFDVIFESSKYHTQTSHIAKIFNEEKYAVTGSKDQSIRVWDLSSKDLVCEYRVPVHFLRSISISKSMKYIVAAHKYGVIIFRFLNY